MANIRATVDASRPMTEPNFSCPKDQNSWLTFRQLTGRARAICGSSRKPVALTEYDRSRNLRRRAVDTRHRHHDGDLWHRARRAAQAAAAILSSASAVELQIKKPPLDYISRGLQARLRGHCVEAAWLDLEEPECASGEARGGGGDWGR